MTNIIIKNQDTNSCILSTGEIVDFSMRNYNQLLKEIKEWRLEKSRLIQLPAYCIFPDKTIHSIISVLPTTTEKLWLVSGFNEIIIDNYGKELIELIAKQGQIFTDRFFGRKAPALPSKKMLKFEEKWRKVQVEKGPNSKGSAINLEVANFQL